VARLIGAPPGYVGYDEGGQLTEAVRRKPYSVILFDEVEKAHMDVFNILLQIMDDGRLTDSHGRTVDFKNTIIIMTSNLGSQHLLEGISENGELRSEAREKVMNEVQVHFRPEFLNRVDEIVLFKPLLREEIKKIISLMLDEIRNRLEERKIELEMTPEAEDLVAREAYDPVYGARPLKRYLQHNIETNLARKMIGGELKDGQKVVVTVRDSTLDFDIK
jgi:ATP-dependent Clp protease ATP-binding subunit ClpB